MAACSALVAALLCPLTLTANVLIYHFDIGGDPIFSGTPPAGPPPWIDATFADIAPGTVQLTVAAVGLTGTEKVTEFYLNLDPALAATSLAFGFVSGTGAFNLPAIQTGTDAFKADGDGKYDILFNFSQTPATAFTGGDSVTYQITGISGLTASSFVFYSAPAGGHGPFLAAAHVQGISATSTSDTTTYSGWLAPSQVSPIPEPASAALLLLAGGSAWFTRRLTRNRRS